MRRLFWVAFGASVGIVVSRALVAQLESARQQLTPGSAVDRIADAVTGFVDEVRAGMAEREDQLRSDLGLDEA